jgi:hypothetical protein
MKKSMESDFVLCDCRGRYCKNQDTHMSKKNRINPHSRAYCQSWQQAYKWFLSGLFLLTFSLSVYSQHDPNKEKSQQIKNNSLPPRRANSLRKTKPVKAKFKTQSKVETTAPPKIETSTQTQVHQADVALPPAGKGSILIDFLSLQLDPYNEPELQLLLNGISFGERKEISDTLLELENVPSGVYTLTVKHPTIEDYQQELEVKIAGRARINPIFNIVRGKLIIEGENGAKIFIDDKYETTILSDNETVVFASLGEHRLKMTREGFTTHQETIFITAGAKLLKRRSEPKTL